MTVRASLLVAALALLGSGCVPALTAASSTPAGQAAMERAGVDPAQIGHVAFGHVINTEPRDMYLSRVAMLQAGIPHTTPAMNVVMRIALALLAVFAMLSGASAGTGCPCEKRQACNDCCSVTRPGAIHRSVVSPEPCRRRARGRRRGEHARERVLGCLALPACR